MPANIDFITSSTLGTDTASYTFTGLALGNVVSDRYNVVVIGSRSTTAGRTISSVTIGGVTATALVTGTSAGAGSTTDLVAMYIANVTSGVTGDVVVNFNALMLRCGVAVYKMRGQDSPTPTNTASSVAMAANAATTTITVPLNGCAIAGVWSSVSSTATWGGIDSNITFSVENGGTFAAASDDFSSASTASITATIATTATVGAIVAASWGPSASTAGTQYIGGGLHA